MKKRMKNTANKTKYVWIDLSEGKDALTYPVHYTNAAPVVDKDNDCRTTQLWLRRIPAGTFTMGSPATELGRPLGEQQHAVTIAQPFYIGVFPVTQRQWELVMGNRPSFFNNPYYYLTRPVECVSYSDIRGTRSLTTVCWPERGHAVAADSFMGKLQARTDLVFDLPTEAQWEYACRKKADGSCCETALNTGKDLTSESKCPNMAEVGRYWFNGGTEDNKSCNTDRGTAEVGSYEPSELGLYDMHGNVQEWCLDWCFPYGSALAQDSEAADGAARVLRGGSWKDYAYNCRAANRRNGYEPVRQNDWGFRVALHLDTSVGKVHQPETPADAKPAKDTVDAQSLPEAFEAAVNAAVDRRLSELLASFVEWQHADAAGRVKKSEE